MTTKPVDVGSLKKGSYVVVDGAACAVTDVQVSKSGKHGHAKVRLTAVGLVDDKKRVAVMPAHEKLDSPIIEKKTAQVLSVQDNLANVMDSTTFETYDLKIPEELKAEVIPGVNVLYWLILNDKVIKQVQTQN
ncbi:MAG: translation initiation factor IF-5A [Nanoarchaeota archaeon]|nr:translation initiation factor IF-5A [Nanoarchaeota archaeon]MBU1005420.1 translation initiation factor IF-5A [Nanoarchaeota archaeon]MBU1946504.1 translation initiation factor IF-5A [Nanoarchaeota archaeon]